MISPETPNADRPFWESWPKEFADCEQFFDALRHDRVNTVEALVAQHPGWLHRVPYSEGDDAGFLIPLISAAESLAFATVRWLLQKGVDVDAESQNGWTALRCLIQHLRGYPETFSSDPFGPGWLRMAKLLLDFGANPDRSVSDGISPNSLSQTFTGKSVSERLAEFESSE